MSGEEVEHLSWRDEKLSKLDLLKIESSVHA